ncbi:glycoside hydrolase family 43 protein [Enterococcus casseliflavus]|uniref:glycoside hydrolase family 43 protein n=1 Tax=Enterococcus casseliflavus TaxID=37734 RepID=UPI003D0E3271
MRNKNGQMWYTKNGERIQAHGGMILHYQNTFYWYGENKEGPNVNSSVGGRKVDFIGISCYSSDNLQDWMYQGLMLSASDDLNDPLYKDKIVERPKVVFNKKTQKFVMWFHYDYDDYLYAACGIATADTPIGPFKLEKIIKPNRKDSRDMTLFVDGEDVFLIHSSDFNKTMYISQLTEDYLDCTGLYTKVMEDQEREAPAIFKKNGYYFILSSGTTGWEPNAALFSRTKYLFSPHKLIDNPCEGPDYRQTFHAQINYIFEVGGEHFLMLDHWEPNKLKESGYSILPIELIGEKQRDLRVVWTEKPFGEKLEEKYYDENR